MTRHKASEKAKARLRKKLPAGPQLDAIVAERVMRLVPHEEVRPYGYGPEDRETVWRTKEGHKWGRINFSTSIAAAWAVVGRLREQWWVLILAGRAFDRVKAPASPVDDCSIGNYGEDELFRVTAETAPLALCRAALQALSDPSEETPNDAAP